MIGALIARKALAGSFSALNRQDVEKLISRWGREGEFIFPGDIAPSGTFRGKAAVEAWFQNFFAHFPQVRFAVRDICVRNMFALGGTNVVAVQWSNELTNREGKTTENSGVSVVHLRGGKVVLVKSYLFDLGAGFRVAWLNDTDRLNRLRGQFSE